MRGPALRRLAAVLASIWLWAAAGAAAFAHEMGAGRVDVLLPGDGTYRVEIAVDPESTLQRLQLEAGLPLSEGLSEEELQRDIEALRQTFLAQVRIVFDGAEQTPVFGYQSRRVELPAAAGGGTALEGTVRLGGAVPAGASAIQVAYSLPFTPYALTCRYGGGEAQTAEVRFVEPGVLSEPLPVAPPRPPSRLAVARQYLWLGFTHILPKGLDHILFVLGIFLLSTRLGPMLAQVTAFTVAHSITLGLSIYGVVSLPSSVVEPLIALSIVYVAAENVLHPKLSPWRVAVVFGFGLLHGLGFAGVLEQLGLPRSEFLTALVTFNVGVELGQLAVILLAFLAVASWARQADWYRRRVVVPASLAIGAVGLYWTLDRLLG